ncbi:hypothetical protein [Mesorhizobium loti]|uniref:hypothetical protein n=1 Tax=Rhizobium loti TaxID=381 RepID=UPI001AEBDDC8|nr:hypothetical protein [Mesorhizobium loti]
MPSEPDAKGDALAQRRSLLPKTECERPAHAIKAANLILWPKLFGGSFAFLQIDDEDIADRVEDHLCDEDFWLRTRLLEEPKFTSNIISGSERLTTGPLEWLARAAPIFSGSMKMANAFRCVWSPENWSIQRPAGRSPVSRP